MTTAAPESMTIGRLARAAGVGIETIRYYQQRALLPVPTTAGAFRHYPAALASRIRFIKRAQELGFSLDEITELLRLEDGTDRNSIRRIASDRLGQIERKLADLMRMHKALRHLIAQCEHTRADLPCPIIATLAQPSTTTAKPAAGAGPIAAPLAVPETLIPEGTRITGIPSN
jgi:Hg(II)-responsive transcriptional regulator